MISTKDGPFLLAWKTGTTHNTIEVDQPRVMIFAQNWSELEALIDQKIEGCILRYGLAKLEGSTWHDKSNLPIEATAGVKFPGYKFDMTPDISYEDSVLELCIVSFGNMIRVLKLDENNCFINAIEPFERLPKIKYKWEFSNGGKDHVKIVSSKESIIQQIRRRAKPNTILKLIVDRVHVVCERLKPTS